MATTRYPERARQTLTDARVVPIEAATSASAGALIAARVVFGGYFFWSGLNHVLNVKTMSGYAASAGVPAPELAVLGTGVLLLVGGLSVLSGWRPRLGLAAIILFLMGVTPVMHAFWKETDPAQHAAQLGNFLKNLGLIGGALFGLAIRGPWMAARHIEHHADAA